MRALLAGRYSARVRRGLGLTAAVAAVLFLADLALVTRVGTAGFDLAVERAVQALPWGPLVLVMELTNWISGYRQTVLGLLVIAALALRDRRAGLLMLAGGGATAIEQVLKVILARDRPGVSLVKVLDPSPGFSFPSGHAVFYTWLAIMVATAVSPWLRPRLRPLLWAALALLAFTACLGRVWAGAHWPTDVAGGFLLSTAWCAFVLWLPERWLPRPAPEPHSPVASIASIAPAKGGTTATEAARKTGRRGRKAIRKAGRGGREAAANPVYQAAARFGYAIRGLLYGGVGVSALLVAVGLSTSTGDQRTTLAKLADNPFRVGILVVLLVGLVAYSLWGLVRAVYDPLRRGDDFPGLLDRLGFAWSGLAYGALAVFCWQLLLRRRPGGQSQALENLLRSGLGEAILVAAGIVGLGVGAGQVWEAYRVSFKKDLKRAKMSPEELLATEWLGRAGMLARGITFGLMGWLAILAGLHRDPRGVGSMSAALAQLGGTLAGRVLLFAVAIGFLALGVQSILFGRRVRMLETA